MSFQNVQSSPENNASQIPTSPRDLSQSYSINTVPSLRPDYVHAMETRVSSGRRFFCLFVTFDAVFITFMWFICMVLTGDNIMVEVKKQILGYNVHLSLFDVVLNSVCRFIVLFLFYGVFCINHWIIIALSTSMTTAFLIAKVFVYEWQSSAQPVFQVLLVLISFVLSWSEAWLFDFRTTHQEYPSHYIAHDTERTERTPLVRDYIQSLPSMYTESHRDFFSLQGSPSSSIHECVPVERKFPSVKLSTQQEVEYKEAGSRILTESWIMNNNPKWQLVKTIGNDVIEQLHLRKGRKAFKLTTKVNAPPKFMLEEMFYKVEHIPSWDSQLLESHKVQTIDENTDITYQVTSDGIGGLVSSRDFVNLRCWGTIDGCYVIACAATNHPSVPPTKKYVRAEMVEGSCIILCPVDDDPNSCMYKWIMNTNLKGWIPANILDSAYVTTMAEYTKRLRKHLEKIRQ